MCNHDKKGNLLSNLPKPKLISRGDVEEAEQEQDGEKGGGTLVNFLPRPSWRVEDELDIRWKTKKQMFKWTVHGWKSKLGRLLFFSVLDLL